MNLKFSLLILAVCFGIFVRQGAAQEKLELNGVEYDLPWPGILPDHPFYKAKMLRDQIWGFLIRDPLRKAQWSLLMADKRIWAAQMLLEKDKESLAAATAIKAEKYLEKAVIKVFEAKERGKADQSFLDKLSKSCLKHEEVLTAMINQVSKESRSVLTEALKYPQDTSEKINQLKR